MTRHGSGMEICDVCKDGTFMPDVSHTNKQCYPCSQVVNFNVEIVIQPCNISHDAIIQCVPGFYRRRARNRRVKDECLPCLQCENPSRECMTYTDTVCCLPNHEAVHSFDDVYGCEERPCGKGQHFDEKADQCVPCPQRTYMPQDVHKHMSCLKCAEIKHSSVYNSTVFSNCTDKSPTLFGCLDGYYRNLTGEPLDVEAECAPCTECQGIISRECSNFEDRVCCDTCVDNRDPERECCENVSCDCEPRCVNGSQCECSSCPKNTFTPTPGLIAPACEGHSPYVIGLSVVCIVCVVAILSSIIACKYYKSKGLNMTRKPDTLRVDIGQDLSTPLRDTP